MRRKCPAILQVVHENLCFISDELVELDNGLLTRSLNPYSKLSKEVVEIAAANIKITSKFNRKLKGLFDGEEDALIDDSDDGKEEKDSHQLDKIFRDPKLTTPELRETFVETFTNISNALDDLPPVASFHERMQCGFEELKGEPEHEQERVNG